MKTLLLVACLCLPVVFAAAGEPQRQPNVVLVLTDDQGYGDLSCHGNPVLKTPQLDRLHAESVRLTDFHVSPLCAPTRAALMTGRHNLRTGVWSTIFGRSILRRDETTMAEVFAANGYRTGMVGKWHLGDNYPYRPEDRGFQEVLRHGGGGVGQTPDYWGNSYFDDTYFRNGRPEKFSGYCTDVWFNEAIAFVERNRQRPFFLYLATNAPHGPLLAPEKSIAPYRGIPGVDDKMARFFGMIACIDENVGRLRQRLRQLDLDENTVLIFMSDNGGGTGVDLFNAGMRGTKSQFYEGGHRVPCFIHWPKGGLQGGRDVGELSAHFDLLPTLVELCGLKPPEHLPWDGLSLAPVLTGRAASLPARTLVVQHFQSDSQPPKGKAAVMTQRWRAIDGKQLFDLSADPGQRRDVAAEHPDVVRQLTAEYDRWWEDVSRRFGEECPIVLGADQENPAALCAMDWHDPQRPPWDQGMIRAAQPTNGYWSVEVERAGTYEVSLRRWPAEHDAPIKAAIDGGKALPAAKARLRIGEFDQTRPIAGDARTVVFRLELPKGPARLQTWLLDARDVALCGAYYVSVKRVQQ